MKTVTEKEKKSKGLTLIELLIAITVITVGILTIFSFLSDILRSAGAVNDEFRAAYKAKEGIEMVRYIRDTNALQERVHEHNWIDYGNRDLYHNNLCGNCCRIPSDFTYGDTLESCTGDPLPGEMTRDISVTREGNNSIEVSSTVFGKTVEGEEFSITAKEIIYNYR